jgi:hypothetical protein
MSSITTIQATDVIASSRAVINTNFSNLNTDKAELASPTFTGTVTTPAIILSSETASTIASFDASKNVKSLATSTYPSLAELAYLKGATSAVQTQITARALKGANTDITSLGGLTTALTVAQGGTGIATTTAYSVICAGTGATGAFQSLSALGTADWVLTSNGANSLPSFKALPAAYSFKNGTTNYDLSTASGTQNIAHNLGATPKQIKITVISVSFYGLSIFSTGVYNGTTNSCVYVGDAGSGSPTPNVSSSDSYFIHLMTSSGVTQDATVAFNSTNIVLTWTKTGSPTGSAYIMWEAIG